MLGNEFTKNSRFVIPLLHLDSKEREKTRRKKERREDINMIKSTTDFLVNSHLPRHLPPPTPFK